MIASSSSGVKVYVYTLTTTTISILMHSFCFTYSMPRRNIRSSIPHATEAEWTYGPAMVKRLHVHNDRNKLYVFVPAPARVDV